MNYNYPQTQYQPQVPAGYNGFRSTPQYPQWTQMPVGSNQVRPVSSIEEVRACPIDFDGSVFYFADVANKRIYTKQINLDGTVSINLYEQKDFPITDQPTNTSYITKEEFEKAILQLRSEYEELLNNQKQIEVVQQPAAQQTTPFVF